MARVLLNALASTAGGGITYLHNVLPCLNRSSSKHEYFVLVPPEHQERYQRFGAEHLQIGTASSAGGTLARMWWEQTGLRNLIKSRRIDVLVSLGNFALFASPARK